MVLTVGSLLHMIVAVYQMPGIQREFMMQLSVQGHIGNISVGV